MTDVKLNTIRALIAEATPKIGRFEASILLAHIIEKPKEYLIAHDDVELSDASVMTFDLYVSMRVDGMPIPYLTGKQEFFGRHFIVDENVLIPRPDTEVLIEQAMIVTTKKPKVIDLGTGSGCIAITLAKECPGAQVTATDLSAQALEIARQNAKNLDAKIRFLQGSWWEAVPEGETFDLIVSNPPYIRVDDEHLAALQYEPQTALTDGANGLSCFAAITQQTLERLNQGGWLLVEHGWDQGPDVATLFRQAGLAAVRTVKDYGGNDRVTMGRKA